MLQIKRISKKFQTGELIQVALDGVSLNLRDNEFVAILGPSGSGKLQPSADAKTQTILANIGYTFLFTDFLIDN